MGEIGAGIVRCLVYCKLSCNRLEVNKNFLFCTMDVGTLPNHFK